ncbi:CBS domain-containing protein [Actinomadura sp. 21ATH]|uniref:CBS domain-containing protein n=1 Tax=Actinomadura sp. 21ATH TaxID=1735444 RepID=UPI0035C1C5BB
MRARELAVDVPTVTPDSSAMEAARLMVEHRLPGLIVVDEHRRLQAVLPGAQLVRCAIPYAVQADPILARVYDETHADRLCAELAGKTIAELLTTKQNLSPIVDGDATAMEVASAMVRANSSFAVVCNKRRHEDAFFIGVVTVARLFDRLLPVVRD